MRISTAQYYDSSSINLQKLQNQVNQTQGQISTHLKLLHYSDNPEESYRVKQLEQGISQINQYKKNIQEATSQNKQVSSVLGSVSTLLSRVKVLGSQVSNQTILADDKTQITNELTSLSDQLKALFNTKDSNGNYLFSGFSVNKNPFIGGSADKGLITEGSVSVKDTGGGGSVKDSGSTGGGAIGKYQYSASQSQKQIQIDGNSWISTLSSGYDLFENITSSIGKKSIVDTLDQLRAAIGLDASTVVTDNLTHLDKIIEHVTNQIAQIGVSSKALEDASTFQNSVEISTQQWLSKLKDIDISAAETQLNVQSLALQATQASFAKISQLSLFNFL